MGVGELRSSVTNRTRDGATTVSASDDATYPSAPGSSHADRAGDGRIARGTLIGRYVVLDELGQGGMGVVYRAYDPELDRHVALKRLRADAARWQRSEQRLLREAQLLAKLNHVNVVAIHDVGVCDGAVYLAMELVEGETLASVIDRSRAAQRSWVEVVELFVQAGRGLAAAHEQGLVHRDFKPSNVMVTAHGVAKVMDFGIARIASASDETTGRVVGAAVGEYEEATEGGAIVGTPSYMSPEQLAAAGIDARADQFSFCVALWAALYGQFPFVGEDSTERTASVVAGLRLEPPRANGVPRWIRQICNRGLQTEPADRFSSMLELLHDLERGRTRRRRRALGMVAAAAAVVGTASYAGAQIHHARGMQRCAEQGDLIAELWNADTEGNVRAALMKTGLSYAAATADRLAPRLERWTNDWRDARVEACVASNLTQSWPAERAAQADMCLDHAWIHAQVLIDALVPADAASVQMAVTAAASLPDPRQCTDTRALEFLANGDDLESGETLDIRRQLARAAALEHAGRADAGRALATVALERAEAHGGEELIAEARVVLASVLIESGDFAQAESLLSAAYRAAGRAGSNRQAARAASLLVVVVGDELGRHNEGFVWGQAAEVALAGHDEASLDYGLLLNSIGNLHDEAGQYVEAKQIHSRALTVRAQALGLDHPDLAGSLNNIANANHGLGLYAEAAKQHRRALEIKEATLGDGHPGVAASLNNLANTLHELGEYEQAERNNRRALEIWRQTKPAGHPNIAITLLNLANAQRDSGQYDAARVSYEEAISIWRVAAVEGHPALAVTLTCFAALCRLVGDLEAADGAYAEAIEMLGKTLGREHPDMASAMAGLGRLRVEQARYDEARELLTRTLELRREGLGESHPDVVSSLHDLARLERAAQRLATALQHYQHALELVAKLDAPYADETEIRLGLVQTYADLGLFDEALAAAESARRRAETVRGPDDESNAELDSWVARISTLRASSPLP